MIHFIIGTKAQLIKIAPIMRVLKERKLEYNFIFTGQHRLTIEQILDNFSVKSPDVILYDGDDVTGVFQSLVWMVKIIVKVLFNRDSIFGASEKQNYDIVLVHGDTFSTLLGALIGRLSGKKIAHVESGLRSFNIFHPFPEEITRLLVFRLTDIFYCPGDWAIDNLKSYNGKKINTITNTLYDCITFARYHLEEINVDIPKSKYALVSIHRFENIFNKRRFRQLLECLLEVSQIIPLLFILHPTTEKKLKENNWLAWLENEPKIELRPRYDYFKFIKLMIESEFIISDGGSNQEEAAYLGKPTLLFRRVTERPEGIGENAVISEYNADKIIAFVENYKNLRKSGLEFDVSPSEIIVNSLLPFS